jgi:hypothetical protein
MTSQRTSLITADVPKSAAQPSQRRLDDEALSRMDDEGGPNNPGVNPSAPKGKAVPGS